MDESFAGPLGKDLFEKEQNDLLADLVDIPKKACDRKVWSLISCKLFEQSSKLYVDGRLLHAYTSCLLLLLLFPGSMILCPCWNGADQRVC